MKKRILSFILAAVMIITALPFAASAAEEKYPVIIDSGYMTSQIFLFDDDGNIEKRIWYLEILPDIAKELIRQIPGVTEGAIEYLKTKDMTRVGEELALSVTNILRYMQRNPDGTPVYNTGVWPTKPEESNMKYIYDNMATTRYLLGTIHEERYVPMLCEKIGAENVFQFSVDWRKEIIFCALDLGKYIKSVLDYTGAKKVNIFSESHGGQTTGTYISMCSILEKGGKEAETLASLLGMTPDELKTYFNLDYINNAVLNSPAIGGVQLAYDFLSDSTHLDLPTVVRFAQAALNPFFLTNGGDKYISETEFEWLIGFIKLDLLSEATRKAIQTERILKMVLSFGSVWDFVDAEHYDEIKAMHINTPKKEAAYAPMLKNTDFSHYIIMKNLNEYLTYARSRGVNVSIVCGTDMTSGAGARVNSDCIVATSTASGAKVADYGYRFSNGYTTDVSDPKVFCKNKAHNHVSPAMNIDASYGYLPDNTWFIENQFHAQYAYDIYALPLTDKLLLTDELKDVYSDPNFPQFESTYNAKFGVHAAFDKSVYGRASSDDTALVIENVSKKSDIELVAIKVEGTDASFEDVRGKVIPMGEKVTVPLKTPINEKAMTNFTVTVYYLDMNSVFSIGTRRFNFTTEGGELAEYDASKPLTEAAVTPIFVTAEDAKSTLENFDRDIQLKALMLMIKRIVKLITFSLINLDV